MTIERTAGRAPRSQDLARDLGEIRVPCVGCPGCQGPCRALIEMMTLPEAVLGRGAGR